MKSISAYHDAPDGASSDTALWTPDPYHKSLINLFSIRSYNIVSYDLSDHNHQRSLNKWICISVNKQTYYNKIL